MDWSFIAALAFALLAAAATAAWVILRRKYRTVSAASASPSQGRDYVPITAVATVEKKRRIAFWSMVGLWVTTLGFFILSCTAFVGANALAVKVNMGRYAGIAASGTSAKLPWVTTDSFETRLQTSVRAKTESKDEPDTCVTVKAAGVQACVDTTARWAIDYDRKDEAAMAASDKKIVALWRAYGDFDAVEEKLIKPETDTVFGNVYGSYSATEAFGGGKTAELNAALAQKLDAALAKYGISVDGITLGVAHLDAKDQENLNGLFASEQDIKKAKNEALAATERAAANQNLKPSLTREVLIDKCLAAQAAAKPAVFDDCGLGDSNDVKAPVIVNQPAR